MIQAGLMRKRVAIEQRSTTQDSAGEPSHTWTTFATVWAEIAPSSGREAFVGESIRAAVSHLVTMRYSPGVTAAMRVNYNGRFFNILGIVNENERNRTLILNCSEGMSTEG